MRPASTETVVLTGSRKTSVIGPAAPQSACWRGRVRGGACTARSGTADTERKRVIRARQCDAASFCGDRGTHRITQNLRDRARHTAAGATVYDGSAREEGLADSDPTTRPRPWGVRGQTSRC